VKDIYQKGIIDVKCTPSREQKIDILTKGLTFEKFAKKQKHFGNTSNLIDFTLLYSYAKLKRSVRKKAIYPSAI